MSMQRSVEVRVTGTVQGVFFRHHTALKAEELSVKGFVQNEPDGSVLLQAEGEASHVNLFLQWCKHGPDTAKVDGVVVRDIPFAGYSTFDIRR